MLHNNYRSHNLIAPYHVLGMSSRNSTSFNRLFLAKRHKQAVHETRPSHTGNNQIVKEVKTWETKVFFALVNWKCVE